MKSPWIFRFLRVQWEPILSLCDSSGTFSALPKGWWRQLVPEEIFLRSPCGSPTNQRTPKWSMNPSFMYVSLSHSGKQPLMPIQQASLGRKGWSGAPAGASSCWAGGPCRRKCVTAWEQWHGAERPRCFYNTSWWALGGGGVIASVDGSSYPSPYSILRPVMGASLRWCWARWEVVGSAVAASIGRFLSRGVSCGSWWRSWMRARVGAPTSRSGWESGFGWGIGWRWFFTFGVSKMG